MPAYRTVRASIACLLMLAPCMLFSRTIRWVFQYCVQRVPGKPLAPEASSLFCREVPRPLRLCRRVSEALSVAPEPAYTRSVDESYDRVGEPESMVVEITEIGRR